MNNQSKNQKFIKIIELLELGYRPQDLLDERVFTPPYTSEEVWTAITQLNSQKKGVKITRSLPTLFTRSFTPLIFK